MTKILDGRELAGFVKERQAHRVKALRSQKKFPCLVILRDSNNPVITKYVELKKRYGEDIGVKVIDAFYDDLSNDDFKKKIVEYNNDENVSGMIVQLPLLDDKNTDEIVDLIAPEKDVDGLANYEKQLQ